MYLHHQISYDNPGKWQTISVCSEGKMEDLIELLEYEQLPYIVSSYSPWNNPQVS